MLLPIVLFSTLFILLVKAIVFPPQEEKKSLEKELEDAISKYVAEKLRQGSDSAEPNKTK